MPTDRVTINRDLAELAISTARFVVSDQVEPNVTNAQNCIDRLQAALASDEPNAEELLEWYMKNEGRICVWEPGGMLSIDGERIPKGHVRVRLHEGSAFMMQSPLVMEEATFPDRITGIRAAYAADKGKK